MERWEQGVLPGYEELLAEPLTRAQQGQLKGARTRRKRNEEAMREAAERLLAGPVEHRTLTHLAVAAGLSYATVIKYRHLLPLDGFGFGVGARQTARLEAAMARLLAGTPERTDGALTLAGLAAEAGVDSMALHRRPHLRRRFRAAAAVEELRRYEVGVWATDGNAERNV